MRVPTSNRGFTLIELMIVVLVIGILAAIIIPNLAVMSDRAKEGGTKANMHTLQMAAEDYGIQNDGAYSDVIDATHIGNLLPPNFRNPFSGIGGSGQAWEDRTMLAGGATATAGIASYADSTQRQYNVKGRGKSVALTLVLTSGN